ncbi:hypothetical protein GHNINEIG_01506 [Hydrogenovibrio crunogenus]|uniref:Uncharacterized protein n=1 Tax=Hydrogenovibrio crunogenus TaxID=39765 RepID=A0A4P7NZZ4_9GAMM|nr:hypothetical protein GHNINEIG_01506 [Hydrogenovibrio crunogenus]
MESLNVSVVPLRTSMAIQFREKFAVMASFFTQTQVCSEGIYLTTLQKNVHKILLMQFNAQKRLSQDINL